MHGWPRVCRALQSAGRHDMQTVLRSPPRQLAWRPFKRHKSITETALFKVVAACLRLLSRAAQGAFRLFWPQKHGHLIKGALFLPWPSQETSALFSSKWSSQSGSISGSLENNKPV